MFPEIEEILDGEHIWIEYQSITLLTHSNAGNSNVIIPPMLNLVTMDQADKLLGKSKYSISSKNNCQISFKPTFLRLNLKNNIDWWI